MGIIDRVIAAKIAPAKAAQQKVVTDKANSDAMPGLWSMIQDELPTDASDAERAKMQIDAMMATGNPNMINKAMELMPTLFGEQVKVPKAVTESRSAAYKQATDMGLVPGTQPHMDMVRQLATQNKGVNIDMSSPEDPISVTDLGKMIMPDGTAVPYGTTPSEAKAMGVELTTTMAAGDAGKAAMLDTALKGFDVIDEYLGIEGDMDNKLLMEMSAIEFTGLASHLVSEEAGQLYQAFETGMQAITRTETGAAMAKEEIENTKKRFMPKPYDKPAVRRQKINAYKNFIKNATEYLNPVNKGSMTQEQLEANFEEAIQKSFKAAGLDESTVHSPGDTWSDDTHDYRMKPNGDIQKRTK